MSTDTPTDGPTREEMIGLIRDRWPDAATAEIEGAIFFSLDEKHWPNFATIVWQDDFDEGAVSNLTARPGVYRVNVGVDKEAFPRLVGRGTGWCREADVPWPACGGRAVAVRRRVDVKPLESVVPDR